MTNEEAINELLQCYSLYSPFKTAKKTNEAISMAIKELEQAPTFEWLMQKADEWGMAYGKQFLIEAQRAWKVAKDTNVPSKSELDHIHNVVRDDAYKCGYEQGKADAAPKWIPFTAETAPKEDGPYLIKMKTATGNESVKTDSYSTAYGEWFIYSNDIVIQWMPIP